MANYIRLSLKINLESARYLKEKAAREGTNLTEAQRRCYLVAKLFDEEWLAGNEVVVVRRVGFFRRKCEFVITPNWLIE